MLERSRASTGSGLHYLKFPGLQPEVGCIILIFPDFNRESVALFQVSRASTGSALLILSFPGFNRKWVALY